MILIPVQVCHGYIFYEISTQITYQILAKSQVRR